jgi:hypothetical protein
LLAGCFCGLIKWCFDCKFCHFGGSFLALEKCQRPLVANLEFLLFLDFGVNLKLTLNNKKVFFKGKGTIDSTV